MASDERQRIIAAWERAKLADPSLTQGEFMLRGSPGKYRNKESAARYLRLILQGKRTGRKLYSEGARTYHVEREYDKHGKIVKERRILDAQTDAFQAVFYGPDGKPVASFDLAGVNARSTFDMPAIEATMRQKHAGSIAKKVAQWNARYGRTEGGAIDPNDFTIRRIHTVRKPFALYVVV